MNIIEWCNDNEGFVLAVLSLGTVLLSAIAIVVSIRTARLPYKKRIKLGATLLYPDIVTSKSVTLTTFGVTATNVGNRIVSFNFIGFAVKASDGFHLLSIQDDQDAQRVTVEPTKSADVVYPSELFLLSLAASEGSGDLYAYAIDTEGKDYKKKLQSVESLLDVIKE